MVNEEVQLRIAPVAESLYFCSLCAKPFSQETSRTRHVQYCRRRAAHRRPVRPKACHSCRAVKSKCDFKSPCSRCTSKRLACSYDKDRATITTTNQTGNIVWPDCSSSTVDGYASIDAQNIDLNVHLRRENDSSLDNLAPISLDDLADINLFPPLDITQIAPEDGLQLPHLYNDLSLPQGFAGTLDSNTMAVQRGVVYPLESSSRYSVTPGPIVSTDPGSDVMGSIPLNPLSNGCRQYLLSIVSSYPRMITTRNSLPPFIHPVGCRLYFDGSPYDAAIARDESFDRHTPLKPLEACINVARVFTSRPYSNSMDDFLWRVIDNEHRHIKGQMERFSLGEAIAALQAAIIFGTMRGAMSGHRHFDIDGDMVKTMLKLSQRCAALASGPFSPRRTRSPRPTWEQWICEETRRRISITCFLLALALGKDAPDPIVNPHRHSLPSSKALWEARTSWEWEREYDVAENLRQAREACHAGMCLPQLETMGDLIVAKLGNVHTSTGDPVARAGEDILTQWYADMDGLSMMLAAVVASL